MSEPVDKVHVPILKEDELTEDDVTPSEVACKIKGLPNVGSTCYLNVILQSLNWTTGFLMMLNKMMLTDVKNKFKLAKKLLIVLRQLRDETSIHQQRKSLKKLIKVIGHKNSQFKGYGQQDSFEMFNSIISEINEEVENASKTTTNFVAASKVFSGVFLTKYKYGGCPHVDVYFQHFTSISVPVIEPTEETFTQRPIKRQRLCRGDNHKMDHFKNPDGKNYNTTAIKLDWQNSTKSDITTEEVRCQTFNDVIKESCPNDSSLSIVDLAHDTDSLAEECNCADSGGTDDAFVTQNSPSIGTKDIVTVAVQHENITHSEKHNDGDFDSALLLAENNLVNTTEFKFDKYGKNVREEKPLDHQASNEIKTNEKPAEDIIINIPEDWNTINKNPSEDMLWTGYIPTYNRKRKRKLNQDEPFTDVELGLKFLMKEEKHDKGLFACKHCPNTKDSFCSQTLDILVPPPVLVLHLNRFKQGINGCLRKNQNNITYPEFLDFTELDITDREAMKIWMEINKVPSIEYRLFSVVCHKGSMYSGHYHAYIRTETKDENQISNLNAMVEKSILTEQDKAKIIAYFQSDTKEKLNPNVDRIVRSNQVKSEEWYYVSDMCVFRSNSRDALNSDCAYMLFYDRL